MRYPNAIVVPKACTVNICANNGERNNKISVPLLIFSEEEIKLLCQENG